MVFDSLSAFLLFAACLCGWWMAAGARAQLRPNLRLAAMLFAALSVARLLSLAWPQWEMLAPAVAMLAAALGGTLITLSLFAILARPLPVGVSAVLLALALGLGLAGALTGAAAYEASCLLAGLILVLAAGLNGPVAAGLSLLAALSLLCGGFALMDGAINAAEIFFAAALIGAASQARVETERHEPHRTAIKVRG